MTYFLYSLQNHKTLRQMLSYSRYRRGDWDPERLHFLSTVTARGADLGWEMSCPLQRRGFRHCSIQYDCLNDTFLLILIFTIIYYTYTYAMNLLNEQLTQCSLKNEQSHNCLQKQAWICLPFLISLSSTAHKKVLRDLVLFSLEQII